MRRTIPQRRGKLIEQPHGGRQRHRQRLDKLNQRAQRCQNPRPGQLHAKLHQPLTEHLELLLRRLHQLRESFLTGTRSVLRGRGLRRLLDLHPVTHQNRQTLVRRAAAELLNEHPLLLRRQPTHVRKLVKLLLQRRPDRVHPDRAQLLLNNWVVSLRQHLTHRTRRALRSATRRRLDTVQERASLLQGEPGLLRQRANVSDRRRRLSNRRTRLLRDNRQRVLNALNLRVRDTERPLHTNNLTLHQPHTGVVSDPRRARHPHRSLSRTLRNVLLVCRVLPRDPVVPDRLRTRSHTGGRREPVIHRRLTERIRHILHGSVIRGLSEHHRQPGNVVLQVEEVLRHLPDHVRQRRQRTVHQAVLHRQPGSLPELLTHTAVRVPPEPALEVLQPLRQRLTTGGRTSLTLLCLTTPRRSQPLLSAGRSLSLTPPPGTETSLKLRGLPGGHTLPHHRRRRHRPATGNHRLTVRPPPSCHTTSRTEPLRLLRTRQRLRRLRGTGSRPAESVHRRRRPPGLTARRQRPHHAGCLHVRRPVHLTPDTRRGRAVFRPGTQRGHLTLGQPVDESVLTTRLLVAPASAAATRARWLLTAAAAASRAGTLQRHTKLTEVRGHPPHVPSQPVSLLLQLGQHGLTALPPPRHSNPSLLGQVRKVTGSPPALVTRTDRHTPRPACINRVTQGGQPLQLLVGAGDGPLHLRQPTGSADLPERRIDLPGNPLPVRTQPVKPRNLGPNEVSQVHLVTAKTLLQPTVQRVRDLFTLTAERGTVDVDQVVRNMAKTCREGVERLLHLPDTITVKPGPEDILGVRRHNNQPLT